MINLCLSGFGNGLLHFIPALGMAVKQSQIEPCQGTAMAGVNRSPILSFRSRRVFFLLGDAGIHPMCPGRSAAREYLRLGLGFVPASTHNPWSLQIELGQIGARLGIIRT